LKRDLCTRLALGALWLCAACTSPAAVLDGGTSGSTSGGTTTGTTTGGPGTAQMRLANLAPRGVATDLCTAVHGSGQFEGPLLGGKGLDAGVLFPAVSGYVSIPAGTFDFRLVAAGGDCSQNLPGTTDLTALPPLAAGGAFTLAEVAGSRQPVQIFEDDIASPDAGSAGLRFINASVDTPSLDLGSEQDGGFTPWVTGEQFLAVGGSAQIYSGDANGYLALPAMANVLLQIESQSKDLLDLVPPAGEPLALIDGALYTLFAVPGKPLDGLLCADSSLPSSGYTPCSLYPLPDGGATVSDGGDGG
jgi:hypothetical protein